MRGLAAAVVAAVLIAASSDAQNPPRPSPRTELILLTGFESGVYHPVGRDIRRLLDERGPELGIELAVVPSRGALQNVVDVFRHPSIQLGCGIGLTRHAVRRRGRIAADCLARCRESSILKPLSSRAERVLPDHRARCVAGAARGTADTGRDAQRQRV
jgi:hypothetical protein